MTNFHVASFICSSIRAILPIFCMKSTLFQELECQLFNKGTCHRKNWQSKNMPFCEVSKENFSEKIEPNSTLTIGVLYINKILYNHVQMNKLDLSKINLK